MMRIGWVFLLLLFTPALYAFEVQITRSFTISGLTHVEGKLVLPSERKKYHNIRMLDKETYDFVSACPTPCVQTLADVTPSVIEVRAVQTRRNMWIAQVAFGRAWLITFLVFQKENDFEVKPPGHFVFNSDALAAQTRYLIVQAVKETL